jgi:hypothetical protein
MTGRIKLPNNIVKTVRIINGKRVVVIQAPTKPSYWSYGG